MAWSFIGHITNYMTRPRLGNQKHPTLWPSDATAIIPNDDGSKSVIGKCRRSSFFRYLTDLYYFDPEKYSHYEKLVENLAQQAQEVDPYMRWIWKQGDLYEEYCLQTSKDSGVYIADQTQVYVPEFNISGKIDIVSLNPETGKYKIVECKSVYGFNGNMVLGTPSQRKNGKMGEPKESYLMQLGMYQWWYANQNDAFEDALIVCGARDTGKFAEYGLTVELNEETGKQHIYWYPHFPYPGSKVDSKITIESITSNYKYIQQCIDSGTIPDKDYTIQFTDDEIQSMYEAGTLTKTETSRVKRRLEQIETKSKKINKQIEKGNWQCRFCKFKTVCFDQNQKIKEISY